MKQLLTTLLFLLLAGPLAAQQGLAVNELFSGNIIPRERMVETRVRGRMLTDYKMSLFRSVKCKVSKEELEKINAAVHRDMTSYKTTPTAISARRRKPRANSGWSPSSISRAR